MSKLPLVEAIIEYTKENNVPFSMPGHKNGRGFMKTMEGKDLYDYFIKGDITEVDGLDNLHHPDGVIKEAQELLKNLYESKKSYFLVNGSTSGNLAMIFSTFNEGDKVIVERNCHRSIFNGIIMRKLKPIYIKNEFNIKYNAPLSIDEGHFLQVINENKDAKGIIITYPNYYGICVDLSFIIREAKKNNMKVLVDSAHGAHFGICDRLPESAIKLGADMVVTSAHKTLPSLTQTAYLHVGNNTDIEKTDFYVSSFLSTSPSYMLMASMDYARFYLQKYGKEDFSKLIDIADNYRKKINNIGIFHVIDKYDFNKKTSLYDMDLTKYVINLPRGYSGEKLLKYLRCEGIQAEMNDESNVILIFSPFNDKEDFEILYQKLIKCKIENLKCSVIENLICDIPLAKMLPCEVINMKKKFVEIENAEGMICGESIVPYPPGVPIIMPGEIYSKKVLNVIQYYFENKSTVLGLKDGYISAAELD